MKRFTFTINWPDHFVGFFSALFGILIAFQLEEWRDKNERNELAQLALQNLQNEIGINKTYYEETVRFNSGFVVFVQQSLPFLTSDLKYQGSLEKADSLNAIFPSHYHVQVSELGDQNAANTFAVSIKMNITLKHPITAAWESAKATGALNYMDFGTVHLLSLIYDQERLLNEIQYANELIRTSEIHSKEDLANFLAKVHESITVLQHELEDMNSFIHMLTTG